MDARGEARRDTERVYGRYRELVGDWPSFADALRAPLDPVVWASPARLDRDELARIFADDGVRSSPLAWDRTALRLHDVARPGLHWGHWAGLYYVQEEASLLPARLLDARPGERVLDLCAAPGSKTARLALAMQCRGTLVANDRNLQRMAAISAVISRLGLVNVTCTNTDGARFPIEAGPFDRVLVDAPCSAEGNAFKNASWRGSDPGFRAHATGVQRALLRRAALLCRVGGRIVYSTCTFAPEEDEAVVDAVLRELDGALRVVEVDPIDGLSVSPGIDSWNGTTFAPELRDTLRLWPHRSGTGGFFAAVLEKVAPIPGEAGSCSATPVAGTDPREHAALSLFASAFGLGDAAFDGHRVLTTGQYARLIADDHVIPSGVKLVSTGMPMTRNHAHGAKLSTAGALAFGRRATRRVVEIDRSDAPRFEARETMHLPRAPDDAPHGYVIVRADGHPLGLGLVREDEHGARLESEFPGPWSRMASGRSGPAG